MPNIAFDLEVFQQVAAATPISGSTRFASLGAIGPDLFRYAPISSSLSDALHSALTTGIQSSPDGKSVKVDLKPIIDDPALGLELFEKPLMTAYSVLFREIVTDFWPLLQRDADLLNQLQTAANNQDGDGIKALGSSMSQLKADAAELKKLGLLASGVVNLIAHLPAVPPAIQSTAAGAKPWLPFGNRLFEFPRWHHTDTFAQTLLKFADTDDKKAYANGWLCHIAGSVTGEPFINSIAGGPYRTHWWRNRLVSNYIDSWSFGRYETPASMSGDTPKPTYSSWKNIRSANLQERFNIAGMSAPAGGLPDAVKAIGTGVLTTAQFDLPAQFPQALADFIQKTIDATYGATARPAGFTQQAVKEAFVGLYGVVWFMTSGFGPMTPLDLGKAPSTCTAPPAWVTDPKGGTPPAPQPAQPPSGPSAGATICGVLLAILAAVEFVFGAWQAGVASVAGAIALFESGDGGTPFDWAQLQCNLYWLRSNLLNAGNALVDGLVKAALAYPSPEKLGNTDANGVIRPAVDSTSNGGVPLTKTRDGQILSTFSGTLPYPHQMDANNAGFADLNYSAFPSSPQETPGTPNIPLAPSYADAVISGSGLQNGGMMIDGAFPSRNQFFGDAVSNAVALIADRAKGLPRYNLDADRGYGWKTWNAQPKTFPGSGDITNPQQES